MGASGHTATTNYSFRLNTSFAPRDAYEQDMAALQQPFLLIAGTDDEAFNVDQYEPVISAHTGSGQYQLVDGASHIGRVGRRAGLGGLAGPGHRA